MSDDRNGSENGHGAWRPESQNPHDEAPRWHTTPPDAPDEITDELERQAREAMQTIRETVGDLGSRVRQALEHASTLWDEAGTAVPTSSTVSPAQERRARELAKRWVSIDFLVDPELPDGMGALAVREASIWKLELRERGEVRTLSDSSEPYRGQQAQQPGPVLPVWDYTFPASPEIEAGERRERLVGTDLIGACLKCNGTGHRSCVACDGKGFVVCHTCHGRARIPCRTCRGRGRIADVAAERRARSGKGYFQVQAERLAADAGTRLADFAERLRQEYGVPLPPSAQWAPTAPASGETIPCPDCVNGTVACECGNGKRVCDGCHGAGATPCPACGGTGRVVRYREVVRRFDTRISQRILPHGEAGEGQPLSDEVIRRSAGELLWEGSLESMDSATPEAVPLPVWAQAMAFARGDGLALRPATGQTPAEEERHVMSRRLQVLRVPVTRVEYAFGGQTFSFIAVGREGAERIWTEEFPPRWSRVSRFFKALVRDLSRDSLGGRPVSREPGEVSSIEAFRARRAYGRIESEDATPTQARGDALTGPASADNPTQAHPPVTDGDGGNHTG